MHSERHTAVVSVTMQILMAFFASLTFAGGPSVTPLLRVDPGMHTAMVRTIQTDARGRYLVTASNDKTVRIWDVASLRLLKILRPPIGDGAEGLQYAAAISPNGETIVSGGFTGYKWDDNSMSIYVYERSSGILQKRLAHFPDAIGHLIFSPDGQYLVVSLIGANGIRVYKTSNWNVVKEDRDYGADTYGAAFDSAGRLATTSFDGFLRIYNSKFELVAKKDARSVKRPMRVSFSPDAQFLAVGGGDEPSVSVFSSHDLHFLYSTDSNDVQPDIQNNQKYPVDFRNVTWSADGNFLYAGGTCCDSMGGTFIRIWGDRGKGAYRAIKLPSDPIMSMITLPTGNIAYATSFGVIGTIDRVTLKNTSTPRSSLDFRGSRDRFQVSYNGEEIQFQYDRSGKMIRYFSLKDRTLGDDLPSGIAFTPPRITADETKVLDWEHFYNPRIASSGSSDTPLPLVPNEISRSLAIGPDGKTFLLGGSICLYHFDQGGNQRWRIMVPADVWGVNVSANGQIGVAALGDGTIRWYHMRDGRELLALYPLPDVKRWVIWTPTGYYDASPGADELIGWHVNNGKAAAADFFPLGKFRSTYYRPDVIAKTLQTYDVEEALRLANKEAGRKEQVVDVVRLAPPIVRIVMPSDDATISLPDTAIEFTVRTTNKEPVTAIKALVDGRPVTVKRGISVVADMSKGMDTQRMEITVPERDVEVAIIAENRFAASEPAKVRLRWRGLKKQEQFVIRPKLYVLAVGVSKYANKDLTLGFAAKDAHDFSAALEFQKGTLYRDVVSRVLTDDRATKDEVLDAFDWIRKETTSKDVAVVFLAGHGVNDSNGIYYFLPANANIEKLMRTGVPFSDIKNTISSLAGKTLFFIDTCHSGNVMGTRRGTTDIAGVVNELGSAENGAIVFAASTGNQYSLENAAWGNGAFTKALIEGVTGKADYSGGGRITINMLDLYLSERVKELTKGKQTPTTTKPQTVPDFPFAVTKH